MHDAAITSTITNTDTGATLTTFYSNFVDDRYTTDPKTGAITETLSFNGLNYIMSTSTGAPLVTAGRAVVSFAVTFDANGNPPGTSELVQLRRKGAVTNPDGHGVGGQAGIYFVRYDGATGAHTGPGLIDDQAVGHQTFPDISADGGVLHAIWWDSRNDRCYSVTRPIGNCADRTTVPSLDVYGAMSTNAGTSWMGKTRISDVTTNPNYEQFDNRSVPFAGDYLWVTSLGSFAYTTWTDYRSTLQGTDPRETTEDADQTTSDVLQYRTLNTVQTKKGPVSFWSGDLCPHGGGIDQNIYGDQAP